MRADNQEYSVGMSDVNTARSRYVAGVVVVLSIKERWCTRPLRERDHGPRARAAMQEQDSNYAQSSLLLETRGGHAGTRHGTG